MNRGGRPTKLTSDVQQKLCDAIRAGNYLATAAAFAGVSESTLHNWLKRGANEAKGRHHDLAAAVEKAMADAEARDVALISKAAADGTWQAAAWRLERRFPDRWGRRDRLDATVKGGITHVSMDRADFSRLSKEELEALEGLYEKLLGP